MQSRHLEMLGSVATERWQKCLDEATTRSRLRQVGLAQRTWPGRATRWLLSCLGRLLVVAGQRLERYAPAPIAP